MEIFEIDSILSENNAITLYSIFNKNSIILLCDKEKWVIWHGCLANFIKDLFLGYFTNLITHVIM